MGHARLNYDTETNEVWIDLAGVIRCPQTIKGLDAVAQMIENVNEFILNLKENSFDFIVLEFPAAIFNPKFSSGCMIPLAGVAGAIYSCFRRIYPEIPIKLVYPTVWNSRKKKEKTSQIIQEIFGDVREWEFKEKITVETLYEHVIDAAGMAYWFLEKNYLEDPS